MVTWVAAFALAQKAKEHNGCRHQSDKFPHCDFSITEECLYWLAPDCAYPCFGATLIVFGAERGISSRDPPANAVQPRMNHSFGNIDIIQLIADFQRFLRNDDFAARNMLRLQNIRQQNDGSETTENSAYWFAMRSIIDDGSKKWHTACRKAPHLIKIRDHFFEHTHGENVASRIGELAHKRRRHKFSKIRHIQTPDHAVAVIAARVLRGEMCGDERRICPVEQAGRQTVVLCDRQQLPKPEYSASSA